jgi:carboxylesterase type B
VGEAAQAPDSRRRASIPCDDRGATSARLPLVLQRSPARRGLATVTALLAVATFSACGDSGCPTGNVQTTSGIVCGMVESVSGLGGATADAFLGIPFAETTAGENRWRPPIPKAEMRGVFRAVASSPGCPQDDTPPFGLSPSETSEDCLTVNVWRPHGATSSPPRPVLAWIYGGSFDAGATAIPMYDGAYMAAQQDVVVVTLNYRIGALGFLAGSDGLTGNYGLMDQQLALQWVRENIAAFGGDPAQVTLFGQSAGAMSVGLQMLSIPSSAGLFRAGIMESNPFGIPFKTLDQAALAAEIFKASVGCAVGGLDCLRAVPVATILQAQADAVLAIVSLLGERLGGFFVFAPTVDGSYLVEEPVLAAREGGLVLPTLIGTNRSDGTSFAYGFVDSDGTVSEARYLAILDFFFGPLHTAEIVAIYGSNPGGDNLANLSEIITDYLFGCASRFVALQTRGPLHAYEFDETGINIWTDIPPCAGEACHGDEVPFVFHSAEQIGLQFTAPENVLANQVIGYWTSFARDLDPNQPGAFFWPPFTARDLAYLIFDTPDLATARNPIPHCDYWDTIGYDIDTPFRPRS